MTNAACRDPLPHGFDDSSWLLILLSFSLVAAFQLVEPFSFSASGIVSSAATIGILAAGGRFYARYRVRPTFAVLLTCMMQIILFSIGAAILSYLVAAHGGPLWDTRFQQWDRSLGLDWLAYVRWAGDHPWVGLAYRWAYISLIPQLLVLVMALSFAGKLRAMRIVVCASMLAGIAAVLISGLMPAVSNYIHLGLTPADLPSLDPVAAYVHRADFLGLRDGQLRAIDLMTLRGIITFPSYHAGLGVIYIWGFTRLGKLGWIGASWPGVMLLATPVDGAHYFVDVFAGALLAVASLALARALVCVPWIAIIGRVINRSARLSPARLV